MQIRYNLLILFLLFGFGANGQSDTAVSSVYTFVDHMPDAGYDYQEYLDAHIRYPDEARAKNIQGNVVIKFVVNEDGSISDCNIVRGAGSGLDEEALRVVKSFPRWKPGTLNGKPVKVSFAIPVKFKLTPVAEKKDTVTEHRPKPEYDVAQHVRSVLRYPLAAWEKGNQGIVRIKFIVNEDGSISDWQVIDSICKELDDEAMRIVSTLPKWKPGTIDGKPAKFPIIIPIGFVIKSEEKKQTAKERSMRNDNTLRTGGVGRRK